MGSQNCAQEDSINYFLAIEFYGITLSQRGQTLSTARNWFLRLGRCLAFGSMMTLILITGWSLAPKTPDAADHDHGSSPHQQTEHQPNIHSKLVMFGAKKNPAFSTKINLKFYYKLSFHFKSYFSFLSYIYVLINGQQIGRLMHEIVAKLNPNQSQKYLKLHQQAVGSIKKLIRLRRILTMIWLANIIANGTFFISIAIRNAIITDQHSLWTVKWINITVDDHESVPGNIAGDADDHDPDVWLVLIREFLWAIYGFGWIVQTVLIMIWICYANYLLEKDTFTNGWNQFRGQSKNSRSLWTLLSLSALMNGQDGWHRNYPLLSMTSPRQLFRLYGMLRMLNRQIDCINSLLGALPFIWLCELFLSTCLRITQLAMFSNVNIEHQTFFRKVEYHLEYSFEYCTLTSFYLAFIAMVEYFSHKRCSLFQLQDLLMDAIRKQQQREEGGDPRNRTSTIKTSVNSNLSAPETKLITWTLILLTRDMLRSYSKATYQSWCHFRLNYRLVFAFLNAVAPFSVMILQLHDAV